MDKDYRTSFRTKWIKESIDKFMEAHPWAMISNIENQWYIDNERDYHEERTTVVITGSSVLHLKEYKESYDYKFSFKRGKQDE